MISCHIYSCVVYNNIKYLAMKLESGLLTHHLNSPVCWYTFVPQFVHFSDCANKTLARPPHEHHVYSMVCTPSFLPLSLCPSACPHPELASPSEHTTCCPSCSTTATLPTLPSLLLRGVPASTPLRCHYGPHCHCCSFPSLIFSHKLRAHKVSNKFQPNKEPTIGTVFLTQKCHLKDHMLHYKIWDTTGQERFHSLAMSTGTIPPSSLTHIHAWLIQCLHSQCTTTMPKWL